jgi:hypothetical protein
VKADFVPFNSGCTGLSVGAMISICDGAILSQSCLML